MKTLSPIVATLLIALMLGWCTACAAAPAEAPATPSQSTPTLTWTPQATIVLPAVGTTEAAPLTAQPTALVDEATPAPTGAAASQAGFTFLSETIPDGSHYDLGEAFHKSWTIQNSGETTWNSTYALVQTGTSPVGEDLNSPAQIPLGADVPPGGTIEIGVDLTAPQQDGQYSVYYQLTDGNGEAVPDSQMWVSIAVGDVSAGTGGGSSYSAQNISAELVGAANQGGAFVVTFCMEMPDSRYWYAWQAVLTVDASTYPPTGGSYDPHGLDTPTRCFSISYPLTVPSGTAYQLSIPKVEIDPVQFQEENCARAQNQLFAAYPGLNFTCTSPGFFYSIISRPSGLTEAQAGALIMDALSNTIYGPWVLEGVAP